MLILQYPEIGLEEPLLPLVLFLEDKSQVLTVIDEILQPSPICILQAGDPRQAAPGLQQGALPDGLHTQSVQGQPDLPPPHVHDVVVVRQPHPLRHRGGGQLQPQAPAVVRPRQVDPVVEARHPLSRIYHIAAPCEPAGVLCLILPAQLVQVDVVPQRQEPGVGLLQVIQAQILITLDAAQHLILVQAGQQADHLCTVLGGMALDGRVQGDPLPHGQRLQPFPQPCLLLRPAGEL